MFELIQKIDNTLSEVRDSLVGTGPNAIKSRLDKIERDLYSGSGGGGIVISSASIANILRSTNYAAGSAGWQIQKSGDVEFQNGTFRGTIYAAAGSFTGGITIGTGGSLSSGQTAYNTGTGFWMEYNGGTPRFSIGNASGNRLTWDGTNLSVSGLSVLGLTLTGALTISTSGYLNSGQTAWDTGTGFWFEYNGGTPRMSIGNSAAAKVTWNGSVLAVNSLTINSAGLAGSVQINTGGSLSSGQTAYNTGTGFWLEYNGGTPRFSLGTAGSAGLTWDGSALAVTGAITASSGSITGDLYVGSVAPRVHLSGSGKYIQSEGFVSGSTGWRISSDGTAEFRDVLVRGTIKASVFSYQENNVVGGDLFVSPNAGVLQADSVLVSGNNYTIDVKDPDYGHIQLFSVNDVIRIKDGTSDTWFTVTSVTNNTTYYTYVITRQSGTATTYKKGTAIVNYGQSGDGYIQQTANTTDGPRISVMTHTGSPWATVTERVRIGNLDGWGGIFGSGSWGWAVGTYAWPGGNFMAYDSATGYISFSAGNGGLAADNLGAYIYNSTSVTGRKLRFQQDIYYTTYLYGRRLTNSSSEGFNHFSIDASQNDGDCQAGGEIDLIASCAGTYSSSARIRLYTWPLPSAGGTIQLDTLKSTGGSSASIIIGGSNNQITINAEGNQLYFRDGVVLPAVDNDVDLGSSTYEFKDAYIDGTLNVDQISMVNSITEFSTDGTMGGNSDSAVPTEKAVVTYRKAYITVSEDKTVGAGKDYTTIQGAIDYFQNKICSGCTITVDAGTYTENLTIHASIHTPNETGLKLIGDTRSLAGHSFVHGQTINYAGKTNGGSGTTTLARGGVGNVTLTVTGSTTNPSFTGWVSGDKAWVIDTSGTAAEYTVSSVSANTITFTTGLPVVAGNGASVTLLPNRKITAASAATLLTALPSCTIEGFYLYGSSTSYICSSVAGQKTVFSRCAANNGSYGYYVSGAGLSLSAIGCTAMGCGTGFASFFSSHMEAFGSFALKNTYGFMSQYLAGNFIQSSISTRATFGLYMANSSFSFAYGVGTAYCTTGFYATSNTYIVASATTAVAQSNTTNYSPSSSDTEGNVDSLITFS